jgi:hypothetical protein
MKTLYFTQMHANGPSGALSGSAQLILIYCSFYYLSGATLVSFVSITKGALPTNTNGLKRE